MISSETSNKVTGSTTIGDINNVRYYVSADDGNSWIAISPIENPFSGIPEILSFNENTLRSYLSGHLPNKTSLIYA